jgi:predicted metalloprotease
MTTGRRVPNGGKAAGGLGAVIIVILGLLFGVDLSGGGGTTAVDTPPASGGGAFEVDGPSFGEETDTAASNPDEILSCDVEVESCLTGLMADTQDVWSALFENAGQQYEFTTMVLYSGETRTDGCGIGRATAGPFYCGAPQDQKVYIDIGAMEGLQQSLGAAGDFAQAYIIAHEVGHHIQAITGISDQVRSLQAQNPSAQNDLSVRQELQADCFAGVWGYYANQRQGDASQGLALDPGDIDEAINAASAVGDDSIQSRAGYVDPHTFTHGTSAQRINWFKQGFNSGKPDSCDTFSIAQP